jgi:hypothetical protein
MSMGLFATQLGQEGRIGEVGLGAEYDINQYDNILDIDFTITI